MHDSFIQPELRARLQSVTSVLSLTPTSHYSKYANRVVDALPLGEYSLANCLAHAFYVPLYLAGPTVTFNAFASQMARPQTAHKGEHISQDSNRFTVPSLPPRACDRPDSRS